MDWKEIHRVGYGNIYNKLEVKGNIIRKTARNSIGNVKIQKEIEFYKYIEVISNFTMPKIVDIGDNYYSMNYLVDYQPLYKIFLSYDEIIKHDIVCLINEKLIGLHKSSRKDLSKEEYRRSLLFETYYKLKERFNEIKDILSEYNYITKVNNIYLISFEKALEKIKEYIEAFILQQKKYTYVPIHGDCQFNNILINTITNHIVFIDPRGYFGYENIYGLAEYDFAKVKFALSGYDIFDNSEIQKLDIHNNNIRIIIHQLMDNFFEKDSIETVLAISIWLGNASSFKTSKEKCIYSYFIAMYYATIYL